MNFQEYIKQLRSIGQYAFTAEQAEKDLGISRNALSSRVYKLKKRGEILSPAKNFYVIIPPEHRQEGCIPAEELVPILMNHLKLDYYVCLLSAALYHGSSHQKPQVFQVMLPKQLSSLRLGKIRINFIYKKDWQSISGYLNQRVVRTGYLNLASPELTAMDLFMYLKPSGGINAVATVLSELIDVLDESTLISLIRQSSSNAWWQRLGYVLEKIDLMDNSIKEKVLFALKNHAQHSELSWVSLSPGVSVKGHPRNSLWKIIENAEVEEDL